MNSLFALAGLLYGLLKQRIQKLNGRARVAALIALSLLGVLLVPSAQDMFSHFMTLHPVAMKWVGGISFFIALMLDSYKKEKELQGDGGNNDASKPNP